MEFRALGRSGVRVPVIGMGTSKTFDVTGEAEESHRRDIVSAAITAGSTLFDSSPMYGESERVLGMALEGRRDQAIVATKVWTADHAESEQQIRRSLDFYGGYIDLYQVHNLVEWEYRLGQLERLLETKQIGAIGVTHMRDEGFPDLLRAMRSGRITFVQVPYSPADRRIEKEVLPLAEELQLGVLLMRPLNNGQLATSSPPPEALKPLERVGVRTWAQAVLKWDLSDPRVTAVIPATSKVERATENAGAGDPPWFGADEREYVAELAAGVHV